MHEFLCKYVRVLCRHVSNRSQQDQVITETTKGSADCCLAKRRVIEQLRLEKNTIPQGKHAIPRLCWEAELTMVHWNPYAITK